MDEIIKNVKVFDPSQHTNHAEQLANRLSARRGDLDATVRRAEAYRSTLADLRSTRIVPSGPSLSPTERSGLIDAVLSKAASRASRVDSITHYVDQLVTETEGGDAVRIVDAVGQYSFQALLAQADVDLMRSESLLPLGDLRGLSHAERNRMASYLSMIIGRVQGMSFLPLDDLSEIADAVVPTTPLITMYVESGASHPRFHGMSVDEIEAAVGTDAELRAALAEYFRSTLAGYEAKARERFISTTILQPLYRDVFVARSEFRWPTWQEIVDMARTHARWLHAFRRGSMQSHLRDTIALELGRDEVGPGLSVLQEATVLGIKHNTVAALTSLADATSPGGAAELGYGFAFEPDSDDEYVALRTPFARIDRRCTVRDVTGLPVAIDDSVVCDDPQRSDSTAITAAALFIAELIGVDFQRDINLGFITRHPVWSGLVGSDTAMASSADASITAGLLGRRLEMKFMRAVLNGNKADSPLSQLFVEANKADLQKVLDHSLGFFALAYKVVLEHMRDYLGAARVSREWSRSALWDQLDSLQITSPADAPHVPQGTFAQRARFNMPYISIGDKVVNVTQFAFDPHLLTHSHGFAHVTQTLRDLGLAAELTTDFHISYPFARSGRCVVDAIGLVMQLSSADRVAFLAGKPIVPMTGRELRSLAVETGRPVTVVDATGSNDVEDGVVALVVNVTPRLRTSFVGGSFLTYAPLEYVGMISSDGVDVRYHDFDPDLADELRLAGYDVVTQINHEPFVFTNERTVKTPNLDVSAVVPHSSQTLSLSVSRWAHDLSVEGRSTASDPTSDGDAN